MNLPSHGVSSSAQAKRAESSEVKPYVSNPAEVLPWLPCTVSLEISLDGFTIGDLSNLARGSVVSTACRRNSELPLYVNGQLIGWSELEVIDDRLAVRITEIV